MARTFDTPDDIDRLAARMVRDTPPQSAVFQATLAFLREEHEAMTTTTLPVAPTTIDDISELPIPNDDAAVQSPIRIETRRAKQNRLPLALVAGLALALVMTVAIVLLNTGSKNNNTVVPAATPTYAPNVAPLNLNLTYPNATEFTDQDIYTQVGTRFLYYATNDDTNTIIDYYTHMLTNSGYGVSKSGEFNLAKSFTAQNATWMIGANIYSPDAWKTHLTTPSTSTSSNAKAVREAMGLLKPGQTFIQLTATPLTAFRTPVFNGPPKAIAGSLDLAYPVALLLFGGDVTPSTQIKTVVFTTRDAKKTIIDYYTAKLQGAKYTVTVPARTTPAPADLIASTNGYTVEIRAYSQQEAQKAEADLHNAPLPRGMQTPDVQQRVDGLSNDLINTTGGMVSGQTLILVSIEQTSGTANQTSGTPTR